MATRNMGTSSGHFAVDLATRSTVIVVAGNLPGFLHGLPND
jgi:hypothetical protein